VRGGRRKASKERRLAKGGLHAKKAREKLEKRGKEKKEEERRKNVLLLE